VLAGAELTVGESATIPRLNFDSGTLNGAGELTVSGSLNWKAGTMGGTGRTVLGAGASSVWSTTAIKDINNSRVFENRGSVVFEAGSVRFGLSNGSSGQIQNGAGATFEFQGEVDLGRNTSGTYPFVNAGTLRKTGVGTTTFESGGIALNNTGTVRVEGGTLQLSGGFNQTGAGAMMRLEGGSLSAAALTFAEGRVIGSGTITAGVTNAGAVFEPLDFSDGGTATLTIAGNYTQQAGGAVEFDVLSLPAGSDFDRLAVTGAAALDGGAQVRNALAVTGAVYPLVSYGSRTGAFGTVTVTHPGTVGVVYQSAQAEFTVTAEGPTPEGLGEALPMGGMLLGEAVEESHSVADDPTGDADGDGLSNLMETAMGSDPLDASDTKQPELGPDPDHPGCLRFVVPVNEDAGVAYDLEFTNELKTWKPLTAETTGVKHIRRVTDGLGQNQIEVCLDAEVIGTIFLRVQIRTVPK
jgi:hypothetical protein